MCRSFCLLLGRFVMVPMLCIATATAGDTVSLTRDSSTLVITIDGRPFATYQFGTELPKPFLLPVRTSSGVILSRGLRDPVDSDHPHHKGMWNAVDEVNGVKFWEERGPIRNVSIKVLKSDGSVGQFQIMNEWQHPESGRPELVETAVITIHPNRLLVYDMTLKASHGDVVFEDTKEGLFGFRVASSLKEKNGGHVVASDGTEGTAACWGKSFDWVDYSGNVDGKTVGVTIMDHPKNFRRSRYHVRDYGLFSINPFGEASYTKGATKPAPFHLKQGESLRLRYAMYFHDGDTKTAHVAEAWEQFVRTSGD